MLPIADLELNAEHELKGGGVALPRGPSINYTLVSTHQIRPIMHNSKIVSLPDDLQEDTPCNLPHILLWIFEHDRPSQLHPTRRRFTKVVMFGHLELESPRVNHMKPNLK